MTEQASEKDSLEDSKPSADYWRSLATQIANALLTERTPSFWQHVKLIHADDLAQWGTLQEYTTHTSITYAHYQDGVKRIDALRRQVGELITRLERLEALDKGDLERYDTVQIDVPRSFLRKELQIPLPLPPHEKTEMSCPVGAINSGNLYIEGKWRKQKVPITRSCPAHILHRAEIAAIRQSLEQVPQEDWDAFAEIKSSRFAHPVLFISHRWESVSHPDPDGAQYRKLCELRDCFMIYDYCSFPQRVSNESEKAALRDVLKNMNRLIKNVVILESPTYISRGWCIYEYILASLTLSTVCDEIRDPDFVRLRNLRATRPTQPENLFRGHGVDSTVQNSISVEIIDTINRILPKFSRSLFTVEEDREIVTELLLNQLLDVLPQKKEYPSPYLGEWIDVPWTREELRDAFQEEIRLGSLDTVTELNPYQLKVPDTLTEAVANNYALDDAPPNTPWTWLERVNAFSWLDNLQITEAPGWLIIILYAIQVIERCWTIYDTILKKSSQLLRKLRKKV